MGCNLYTIVLIILFVEEDVIATVVDASSANAVESILTGLSAVPPMYILVAESIVNAPAESISIVPAIALTSMLPCVAVTSISPL